MAKANPFRFSTKYQDDETDWVYYGYRCYNSSIGRFISEDPIGEHGGLNIYVLGINDPISRIDELGLCCDVKSVTLSKSRVFASARGFHWKVIGDVQFRNRQGCLPIQWEKGTVWDNGKQIPTASTGAPFDGTWHVDMSPYKDDAIAAWNDVDLGGVDIIKNDDHELKYLDVPGWNGLTPREIYSFHVQLKLIVYDISSTSPKVVKESNIVDLHQAGIWPNIDTINPK
jgi:RHS repeat-associated protein